MIKRIQLRGISRSPSDRMTSDGGCAESLNVYLDNDETAPTPRPDVVNNIQDDRGVAMFPWVDWGNSWEAVFIHTAPSFKRAIIKWDDSGTTKLGVWGVWNGSSWSGSGCTAFMSLASGETFIRCINLGNSLGVVTSAGTYWVLMRDGVYKYLGKSIPFPSFTLANYEFDESDTAGEEIVRTFNYERFFSTADSHQLKSGFDTEHLTRLWEEIDLKLDANAKQGIFNKQQFAVFALRLFDGTRLISSPVLLSAGFGNPYKVEYEFDDEVEEQHYEKVTVTFKTAYKIFASLDESSTFFSGWEEIVDAVEIYLSPQIEPGRTKSEFGDYEVTESGSDVTAVEGELILGAGEGSILSRYIDSSNFYRVFEMPLADPRMADLRSGMVLDTKDFMKGEDLVTRGLRLDTLSDMRHYGVRFDRATLFNNKILASGINEEVKLPLDYPIATYYKNLSLNDVFTPDFTYRSTHGGVLAYKMTFLMRDSSGKSFSVKATNKGGDYFFFGGETIDSVSVQGNAYGFIICPDSRAYAVNIQAFYGTRADIIAGSGTLVGAATLNMTEHPNLDCSYWYGDIESELVEYLSASGTYTAGAASYIDIITNKVYASAMDNPFVFPVGSRYTLRSKVLGCAIATEALSTGQFGQFPVYVFTSDGIWALETASDGSFVSTKPLGREVCVNPDSITPIDNAVVFVTERSVALITGSQVVDLSPFMSGKHYAIPAGSGEHTAIGAGDWASYLGAISDNEHFMSFMATAQIAYDYKGRRLIFISKSKPYQYVYMLKTQTWHKMFVDNYGSTLSMSWALNAYPETYANVLSAAGRRYIWDLSTRLDVTSTVGLRGVIITRPIDLGEPDVRKTIKSIRVRGQLNRGDARYLLLGSFDGVNWRLMTSLRSGSYKLFRIILLTNLAPTERVSWIDIDYETRFNNRLR